MGAAIMTNSPVITRFAPSPTGYLHIGGARSALFNWLYARHHGGTFLLRIEDTDRARSTEDAIHKIFEGLKWMGLDWDGEPVFQFSRAASHAAEAHRLLAEGKAYHCYASAEELENMRAQAKAEGRAPRYDGRWRDRDPADAPAGVAPTVRLKAPREGETLVGDLVQGDVRFPHSELDDMILLRSDGTPTYMLSVVVDDHEMAITHVIRGDDHLTNTARQIALYDALGWGTPTFAHIPLIHGADGAKLSKRHGALGVEAYRDMGYLPETLRNYLLRLGWSHGDEEIISSEDALRWFDLDAVGRSPSRLDLAKLDNLNGHYLRQGDDARLVDLVVPLIEARVGHAVDETGRGRLQAAMAGLKERAKTVLELAESADFYVIQRPIVPDEKASALLNAETRANLAGLAEVLAAAEAWTVPVLEEAVRAFAEAHGLKLGKLAQPLRAALTGRTTSPPIFDVLAVLGREESLARMADAALPR